MSFSWHFAFPEPVVMRFGGMPSAATKMMEFRESELSASRTPWTYATRRPSGDMATCRNEVVEVVTEKYVGSAHRPAAAVASAALAIKRGGLMRAVRRAGTRRYAGPGWFVEP